MGGGDLQGQFTAGRWQCLPASCCSAVGWVSARRAERFRDPPGLLLPTHRIKWPKIFHASKLQSSIFVGLKPYFGQSGPCWRTGRNGQCSPWKGEAAEGIGTGLHTRTVLFLPAAKHFSLIFFYSTLHITVPRIEKRIMREHLRKKMEREKGRFLRGGFPSHCLFCVVLAVLLRIPVGPCAG